MSSEISSQEEIANMPNEEQYSNEETGKEELKESNVYKVKQTSKTIRVLTVMAYLLLVSLAAILLSLYYILVWKSPQIDPRKDASNTNHQKYVNDEPITYSTDINVSPPPPRALPLFSIKGPLPILFEKLTAGYDTNYLNDTF